jgi:hypothetical protein
LPVSNGSVASASNRVGSTIWIDLKNADFCFRFGEGIRITATQYCGLIFSGLLRLDQGIYCLAKTHWHYQM